MSELFSCDFCMSFWAGVILLAFVAGYNNDGWLIFYAVCTTPITRMLL
jgi:hypothetical protein